MCDLYVASHTFLKERAFELCVLCKYKKSWQGCTTVYMGQGQLFRALAFYIHTFTGSRPCLYVFSKCSSGADL
jgi:hypothetical protein